MGMKIILLCCFLVAGPLRITGMPQPNPLGTANITSPSDLQPSESNGNPSFVEQQAPRGSDDSDMYMEPQDPNEPQEAQTTKVEQQTEPFKASELEGGSQTFYPSFLNYNNQPLGHSRPFYYPQQEAAYSQRPGSAFRNQQLTFDNNLKYNNPFRRENYQTAAADNSAALLGSGNFGVIRGGTFYNENDEKNDFSGRFNNYSPYYHNNGHGRPSFYFGATNPRPTQHEQFANFRDFADINTPNPAYSEYVVVYINKNGSAVEEYPKKIAAPKNIIERLAMIDLESKKPVKEDVPLKKLSLSKRKLALLTPEKKYKVKKTSTTTTSAPTSSDLYEPLLALS